MTKLPEPQDSFTQDELDRFDVIYTKYYEHCNNYQDLENKCVEHMLYDGVKLIYVPEIREMVRERFDYDVNRVPEIS